MAPIQGFRGHKDLQILVVGEDLNGVAGSFKVVAPMSHGFDNGEQLAIVNIVVALSQGALARVESNRMTMGIMKLAYNARNRKSRSIGVQANGKIKVEVFEDGGGGEAAFQFIKCGLGLARPVEPLAFSK